MKAPDCVSQKHQGYAPKGRCSIQMSYGRICSLSPDSLKYPGYSGRGREIRTPDILLPKQARYQTALYPGILRLHAVLISLLRREITKCILHFALRVALTRDKIAPGDFYRTPDILLPKQARYQTALYPGILRLHAVLISTTA